MPFIADPNNLCTSNVSKVLTGGGENGPYPKRRAFDGIGNADGGYQADLYPNGLIAYNFETPTIVNKFSIYIGAYGSYLFTTPWVFFGTNDTSLRTRTVLKSFNTIPTHEDKKHIYEIDNNNAYNVYGIYVSSSGDIFLSELEMMYESKNKILFKDTNNNILKFNNETTQFSIIGNNISLTADIFNSNGVEVLPEVQYLKERNDNLEILVFSEKQNMSVNLNAIPRYEVVKLSTPLSFNDSQNIDSITITSNNYNNSKLLFLFSPNDKDFFTYKNGAWSNVGNISKNNFLTSGMDSNEINNLNSNLNLFPFENNKRIYIHMLIEINNNLDSLSIDNIKMEIDLKGTYNGVPNSGTKYEYSFVGNNQLQIKIYESGTYKINY